MQRGTEDQMAGLAKMVVAAEAETVAESCGSGSTIRLNDQLQEDQMKPEIGIQLKHRYDQLPAGLKHFMLYLSLFPKGHRINKKRLLYRWIAEGIVNDLKQGESLLELFDSYLNELVAKELVELDDVDNDGCTTCQVPGAMHNFLVSDAISQGFACLVGSIAATSSYGGGDSKLARLLSVQGDDPAAGLEGKDMSYLRSLSLFDPQDHHKLLDRLAEFTHLRMLDLEGCTAVEDRHVKLVCGLVQLRFLSFNDADITVIPDEISGLENLQTLSVNRTCLSGLPDTVTNLVNLEHIYFSNKHRQEAAWTLPRGIKKMKALRWVTKAGLGDDLEVAEEIGELTALNGLGLVLFNSGPVLQELAQALSRMGRHHLQFLALYTVDGSGGGIQKLNFLHNIPSPPLLLRFTRIAGAIDRLPDWVKLLRDLTEINLTSTELRGDHILGMLCVLPSLLSITLWRNSYTDSELVARAEFQFPVLKKLSVVSDLDEQKVLRFEQGSMPTLETLEYRFGKMDKTIIGVEHLTGLKQVNLLGNRDNPALTRTEEELKSESNKRSSKIKVEVEE